MYEVNANGNRSYKSDSAAKVAGVAVAWSEQGHEPHAYAIRTGDSGVEIRRVQVTTRRETARALKAA